MPYGVEIRQCTQSGQVALTFDDGPASLTTQLLDLLDARQARATFFINGNNAGQGIIDDPSTGYPDVLRRMLNSGHHIGSHGWSHKDLNTLGPEQRRSEIIRVEQALAGIAGVIPTYFRPPYGSCDGQCLQELDSLGYHVVSPLPNSQMLPE